MYAIPNKDYKKPKMSANDTDNVETINMFEELDNE